MRSRLAWLESVVRNVAELSLPEAAQHVEAGVERKPQHPFDQRNIHPKFPEKVKKLFDDGHFAESTYHAYKYLDKKVESLSGIADSGFNLMMKAFNSDAPKIKLTALATTSERDEQDGYRFVFAGAAKAIRNPRAHEVLIDDPDTCLDHLSFISLLIRRLEQAGYV